ncbi:MAG: tetratricopeptide repeat protein [Candidatus Zixiibacteriota bacterium]
MEIKTVSKITLGLALILISLSIMTGCGAKYTKVRERYDAEAKRLQDQAMAEAYNHFTNANIIEILGATDQAIIEYEKALEFDPTSPTIRTDYARLLFRVRRVPEALTNALQVEPKNSEIHLLIGDCYRLTNNEVAAKSHYRQAVDMDPDNINAYWYLAGYYQKDNQPDSAIWAYYELARLSDTYRIWHELGLMLGTAKRYDEAKDAFLRSIEINPEKNNINSYLGLAATYDALDQIDLAETYLNRASELDPYDVRVVREKVRVYRQRNDIKKTLEASAQLVKLVPSDWEAVRFHGFLLYVDGQLHEADSLFRERIEFGDEHPLNFFYVGRIAIEWNNLEEARTDFTRCVTRDSSFADGWLNLAFTWRQQDSLDAAIEVYRRGLEYITDEEDRARLLFALGSTLERNNQFHEAVTTFQDLISMNPNHDPALNYLGYMLADAGQQLQYALELIERAMELSPNNGAYLDSYGWVQFKLGNYKVALAQLQKAAQLIDSDPVVFEHMGDVYKKLGETEKAMDEYKKALEMAPDSFDLEEKMK